MFYRKTLVVDGGEGRFEKALLVGKDGRWRGWRKVRSFSVDEIPVAEAEDLKIETSKNYVIEDYPNPPKSKVARYRRKIIYDKEGQRHIATIAVLKDGSTRLTSLWHPKTEKTTSTPEVRKHLKG
ncbi:MAG: hypothetical protein QW835_00210 [Candidatus Hadarchaeum sp.]